MEDANESGVEILEEQFSDCNFTQSDAAVEEADNVDCQLNEARSTFGGHSVISAAQDDSKRVYWNMAAVRRDGFEIRAPPVKRARDYVTYDEPEVEEILEEYNDADDISYLVKFADERVDEIPYDDLFELYGGEQALDHFNRREAESSDSPRRTSQQSTRIRRATRKPNTLSGLAFSSDSELSFTQSVNRPSRQRKLGSSRSAQSAQPSRLRKSRSLGSMTAESGSEDSLQGRRRRRGSRTRSTRDAAQKQIDYSDKLVLEEGESEDTDAYAELGKRKRTSTDEERPRIGRPPLLRGPRKPSPYETIGIRKSGRNVRSGNMRELGEDEIPEEATVGGAVKFVGAKEHFKQLPGNDDFRLRHCQACDTCNEYGDNAERGRLVYCQGCTLSYHQKCLGARNSRDHLVTKIAQGDFVLQCRRCISFQKTKESTAPDQAKCFICSATSKASHPFRERKSVKQEQKDREDNDGEDPITEVLPDTINNPDNVLFRCLECTRACHFHHLSPRVGKITITDLSIAHIADDRFTQYCKSWACEDCSNAPALIDSLVAWRPVNVEIYQPGPAGETVSEDAKEYLIKWKKIPYLQASWMPGPWVWGVTAATMRKAFNKRDGNTQPKMQTQDAIPEEYHRIDIVFDIEYTNIVKVHTVEVDQARIKEVERAMVKFKGLGYEDVVWIKPPKPEQTERWEDYKTAYNNWVMGSHVHPPRVSTLSATLVRLRARGFGTQLELKVQPENLTGGKLMKYQLEGINWLYYQWFRKQNAILADEMGLGKTIQLIGFMATLSERHSCYPFLVVVPNSTCPNWRREIKQWAPSMRVVTYYGSSESRKLAQKYELFPGGAKELRCHVVVTSYDAAQDDEFRRVFRGVHWAGLVVDEGQRLKNDKNILYGALNALRIPFKVLLTGTPLQNNPRELFNLLQFLDTTLNAKELEEEYAELTKENVPRLHEMLRPFFLRRTKAEVLDFLPPMSQIIVPVSLTSLQKKLYRSILAKNPELIRSIFGAGKKVKQQERASLNNILMQLRKCLCHPFVYSRAIEQIDANPATSHRNLVEASSKLRLLEIMLPKLQERGHRVLIFSQFLSMLDMIEDFMDGLGLFYQRLDGSMGSLQKQKRIDEYNAPDSQLFAFLLSTRAGGVGINLATADTVIILDPDFNPHQDIQALSRAHRIGQKKKVLVFQLTTRGTAEEKIMQVGKKKMALDHVLIEKMDAEDDAGMDLESILRYGTDAIFKDDNAEDEIRYDSSSVDKLLDRSQIEDTLPGKDNSAESQFNFARVWANDKGVLEEERLDEYSEPEPDPSIWDAILQEREREAAKEAAATAEALGRGQRKRQNIDYTKQGDEDLAADVSPVAKKRFGGRAHSLGSESDTDFQAPEDESDGDADLAEDEANQDAAQELDMPATRPSRSIYMAPESPTNVDDRHFKRAEVPVLTYNTPDSDTNGNNGVNAGTHVCVVCHSHHLEGYCPIKFAGVEICGICGIAHFGHARTCPHLNSITQLYLMVEALKNSPEPQEIKDLAKKRVVGLIGSIRQKRRQEKEAKKQKAKAQAERNFSLYGMDGVTNGKYANGYETPNGMDI